MTSKSRWNARIGLLGLLIGAALVLVALPVASAWAAPVIETPAGTKPVGAKPTISGSTTAPILPVSLTIYAGAGTSGAEVQSFPALIPSGAENSWSVVAGPLKSGEYTAVAEQALEPSEAVIFEVDASSPHVTLKALKSPSNDRTPTFTGTASATTKVVVQIYEGEEATGSPVSEAEAKGTGEQLDLG